MNQRPRYQRTPARRKRAADALAPAASRRSRAASRAEGEQKVTIELSRAQVNQVVRQASEGGAMSTLLNGLGDLRQTLSRELDAGGPSQIDDRRLSRSLLLGLLVLALLPADGSTVGIGEIADVTGMSKSTSHRYVSTLVAVGLAERDAVTRTYRLARASGGRGRG